jgi:hypothetical protein
MQIVQSVYVVLIVVLSTTLIFRHSLSFNKNNNMGHHHADAWACTGCRQIQYGHAEGEYIYCLKCEGSSQYCSSCLHDQKIKFGTVDGDGIIYDHDEKMLKECSECQDDPIYILHVIKRFGDVRFESYGGVNGAKNLLKTYLRLTSEGKTPLKYGDDVKFTYESFEFENLNDRVETLNALIFANVSHETKGVDFYTDEEIQAHPTEIDLTDDSIYDYLLEHKENEGKFQLRAENAKWWSEAEDEEEKDNGDEQPDCKKQKVDD